MGRRASFASRISSLSRKIKIFKFVLETKISISNKLTMVKDLGLIGFVGLVFGLKLGLFLGLFCIFGTEIGFDWVCFNQVSIVHFSL